MSWFLNLLSGWLPIGINSAGEKKSFGEWAGKIVWVVGIVLVVIVVVKIFEKKSVTTIQAGGTQIVNQGDTPRFWSFGCNISRLYLKGEIR